jgi:hypothetical protein
MRKKKARKSSFLDRRWTQKWKKIDRLVEKKKLSIMSSNNLLINSANFVKIPAYSNRVLTGCVSAEKKFEKLIWSFQVFKIWVRKLETLIMKTSNLRNSGKLTFGKSRASCNLKYFFSGIKFCVANLRKNASLFW